MRIHKNFPNQLFLTHVLNLPLGTNSINPRFKNIRTYKIISSRSVRTVEHKKCACFLAKKMWEENNICSMPSTSGSHLFGATHKNNFYLESLAFFGKSGVMTAINPKYK